MKTTIFRGEMLVLGRIPTSLPVFRSQHGSTARLQIPFFKEPSSFVGGLKTVGKPCLLGLLALGIYIYIVIYGHPILYIYIYIWIIWIKVNQI